MILREVAVYRYSIYAVCDFRKEEGRDCEVEEFLHETWKSYPKAMRDLNTMLRQWTPQYGPPFDDAGQRAKRLRDGICEFRAKEKGKRQVPRILFFEDDKEIICANAFFKESSTPDHEIERAIIIRRCYFRAKARGRKHIRRGWKLQ
jgi:hypothetical protein